MSTTLAGAEQKEKKNPQGVTEFVFLLWVFYYCMVMTLTGPAQCTKTNILGKSVSSL